MAITTTQINPLLSTSNPPFQRNQQLITSAEIVRDFLFGVPLKDSVGNPLSMETIERFRLSAISTLENDLSVTLSPNTYIEPYDYRAEDYDQWFFMKLAHRPMSPDPAKTTVQIQYVAGQTLITLPQAWYRIYAKSSQIQMTPTSGTMGQFFISAAGVILPGIWGATKTYPQLILVTYEAGFPNNEIPPIFNQFIGYRAAVDVLMLLSNSIGGMIGVNSYGIGLDGMNQSVVKEGFQKTIDNYNERADILLDKIMKNWHGPSFDVI